MFSLSDEVNSARIQFPVFKWVAAYEMTASRSAGVFANDEVSPVKSGYSPSKMPFIIFRYS